MAEQRRVVCAAVLYSGGVMLLGARHFDLLMHSQLSKHRVAGTIQYGEDYEQGFVDNRGQFMGRHEAYTVAMAAGQRIYRCGGDDECLYSENLY